MKNTTRKIKKNTGSCRNSKYTESEMVLKFIEILNIVKIYHWKTFTSVAKFKQCIEIFKKYLVNMSNASYFKNPENSDLLNIRDEILGDFNKFTYLLTFH